MGDQGLALDLAGAGIQKVVLREGLVALRLRHQGETWVVFTLNPPLRSGRGAHTFALVPWAAWRDAGLAGTTAPRGDGPRFRAWLEGAQVERVTGTRLVATGGGHRLVLQTSPQEVLGVTLTRVDVGVDVDDLATADPPLGPGDDLLAAAQEGNLAAQHGTLSRALSKARQRLQRRAEAIAQDLTNIEACATQADGAALFVAAAATAPPGARELTVTDWSTGDPVPRTMALDPAKPARLQLDALFRRARRLKLGRAAVERRLADTQATLAALQEVATALTGAATREDLEHLAQRARRVGGRDLRLGGGATGGTLAGPSKRSALRERNQSGRKPYRTFHSRGGPILVGRGARDNDDLTFRVARPHDLWLHAKGQKGAHVIVPLDRGKTCPAERLLDAAHLAAHFSDARGEGVVEIQHTARRFLRKPKGAVPGLVVVDREKVLLLRVDAQRLPTLLAAEDEGP